jgi:hypothetical protein
MNKAVLIILMCAALVATPAVASQPALSVGATSDIVDGKPVVVFKVTNTTSQPVQISVGQLPWKNRHNTVIAVVNRKSGESAKPKFRIDDNFETSTIDIRAGQTLQGTVSLERYVVGLGELLQKDDALVFWHYAASGESSAAFGEQGGWFALSRNHSR